MAGSQPPHGALSSVEETTTFCSLFNSGAIAWSVAVGQKSTNNRYVVAPSNIVSMLFNSSRLSPSASPCAAIASKKSSSPFGPAANPSSVTYS
ncbi:MAG TPA: hypothetical protein VGD71_43610 [Kribbella sp.]